MNTMLPIDMQQVPDIFLHIYSKTFTGQKRVGYVRVQAGDASLGHNFANWYPVKDPGNNFEGSSPGLLLANLRVLQGESCKMPRPPARYDNEAELNFYAYVYSCVELAPETENHLVKARLEFSFCDLRPNQENYVEEKKAREQKKNPTIVDVKGPDDKQKGQDKSANQADTKVGEKDKKKKKHSMIIESEHITKNPIFGEERKGEFIVASAKVTGGLDMAPSLIVKVYNTEKKSLISNVANLFNMGKDSVEFIGSCYISPVKSKIIKGAPGELKDAEPQFYTILGPDGRIQGKILMFIGFSKNLKESIPEPDFKKAFELKMKKFKLDFSCVGLRNLDSKCPNPEVTLRIPSYQLMIKFQHAKTQQDTKKDPKAAEAGLTDRGKPVQLGKALTYSNQEMENSNYVSNLKDYNPNVCLTYSVGEITLPEKALLWPRAEVEVRYSNILRMESEYFASVDLVECCPNYPKSNAAVMKEKLGMQKRATDTAGDKQDAEDKGLISMTNEVGFFYQIQGQLELMYRNTIKASSMEDAGKGKVTKPTSGAAKTEKAQIGKGDTKDPLLKDIDADM